MSIQRAEKWWRTHKSGDVHQRCCCSIGATTATTDAAVKNFPSSPIDKYRHLSSVSKEPAAETTRRSSSSLSSLSARDDTSLLPITTISRRQPVASLLAPLLSFLLVVALFETIVAFMVEAIAQDSLACLERGDCPDPSHVILRLHKRDDELAQRLAGAHGMVVKVEKI